MSPDSRPPNDEAARAQDGADRSQLWRPRRASFAGSVEQYSKFVAIMKIALPTAAALLLLIVIFLPLIREQEDRFRIGAGAEKVGNTNALNMTNARYYGTDEKGEPYTVTAQNVQQEAGNDRVIDLTLPKTEITMKDGTWLSATADKGVFDRDTQVVDLTGDVTVYEYQGNELHTAEAKVNLKDGNASGDAPVTGHGPFGELEAKGFTYNKDSKVIRFTGPAHLVINNDKAKKSTAPASTAPASTASTQAPR